MRKHTMNIREFMRSELGGEIESCITAWDKALEEQWLHGYDTQEYRNGMQAALWCQAQWEAYQLALKHFYGVEYHFTRTDEYFGICTEDESNFLMRVDRGLTSCSKPALEMNLQRAVDKFGIPKKVYIDEATNA